MHRSVKALLEGKTFTPTESRNTRFHQKLAYEDINAEDGGRPNPKRTAELATAKWVGEKLEQFYPGHPWMVEVSIGKNGRDGLIKFRLNGIMPAHYWYILKMSAVLTDPGGRTTVLRGGGELLERYKLPRANFDLDHWRVAMNNIPTFHRLTGRGHVAPLIG